MNGAGDFANHHLSALADENLHWNLACDYMSQIFLDQSLAHGGRASPRNGIFANVDVLFRLTAKILSLKF